MKDNAYTNYKRDESLYKTLLAAATETKLPILTSSHFERLNAEHGKEKMRKHLADMTPMEAMDFLKDRIKRTDNNAEFLISMNS